MKYMGSKRTMLQNGLGQMILDCAPQSQRVVDLFSGAGSVAWFAAQHTPKPVLAVDLQTYSMILARAVIERTMPLDAESIADAWLGDAERARDTSQLWQEAVTIEKSVGEIGMLVAKARSLCAVVSPVGPIWNAYGGHYLSPRQALTFDYMLKCLPPEEPQHSTCLAATISAASKCVAAPGHTAQPFQPTTSAAVFLSEAWGRDPIAACKKALHDICSRRAQIVGRAYTGDALGFASTLKCSDLVIVDPPYSSVQYSRFYHVLETIARGWCSQVDGVGRYPPMEERPQSAFSNRSQSGEALDSLLATLAQVGATVIFTFPSGECTNGLSGKIVMETASRWYDVGEMRIAGEFSTLGGNNYHRASRKPSSELLMLMRPAKR